jgi:formiminoglutamase
MDIVNNPFIDMITYEDIFILEKKNFVQAVLHAIGFTEENYTGIELDLDSIEGVLSSAETPSGISSIHARQYLSLAGHHARSAYLHISEGVYRSDNGDTHATIGKLISYLVSDFIKAHSAGSGS